MKFALTAFILLFSILAPGQSSFPVRGQKPSTAFPVCGSNTFKQSVVPRGSNGGLMVPGCGPYTDLNPFWYSFTCYQSGSLGFRISPNNLNDDYDWMLFDITGHDPADVYRNSSLVVTGNWSGTSGITGASNNGSDQIECASIPADNINTFSKMPNLIEGHQYLLLISHYTPTQSGYSLTFSGGTAIINDPKMPTIAEAFVGCNKKLITIVTNKKVQCSSLAPDGSDFILNSALASVVSAAGSNCNNVFDMDTIFLTLNNGLTPGNYSVETHLGSDNNTLLDDCGSSMPAGQKISFTVIPPLPTPMDSLITPVCAPDLIQLVFSDAMSCSSIAADGSDFSITGSYPVTITSAYGNCANDLTRIINIKLSSPITRDGNFQITLKQGNDGTTIINECGQSTAAGATLSFAVRDTVSADFVYDLGLGCIYDTINVHFQLSNGMNTWSWKIDSVFTGSAIDMSYVTRVFGPKSITHIVSNGFCSDTVTHVAQLDNMLKAVIQSPDQVCPKDYITFTNASIGQITSTSWNFGDGFSSLQINPPPHLYPDTWEGKKYEVRLIVKNNIGCADTSSTMIAKLQSCVITVPNAFTPNSDNHNDYLYPLNAFAVTGLEFRVFNRFGQLVFETNDWSKKWDGTIHGIPQPTGMYVWTLSYMDGSGKKITQRGTTTLIR